MVSILTKLKIAENFSKEFIDQLEFLVARALMKDNKQDYLSKILKLINECKSKMVVE